MTFVLTAGQRHETTRLEVLMEQGAVKRVGRGRPELQPKRVEGDKASSSRKIRQYFKRRGIGYTIRELAAAAGIQVFLLSHLSPPIVQAQDQVQRSIRRAYTGEITFATDLMQVNAT